MIASHILQLHHQKIATDKQKSATPNSPLSCHCKKTSARDTIHRLFVSTQREIIANILITNRDTQEEQPTDQRTPAK